MHPYFHSLGKGRGLYYRIGRLFRLIYLVAGAERYVDTALNPFLSRLPFSPLVLRFLTCRRSLSVCEAVVAIFRRLSGIGCFVVFAVDDGG